jgi:hypothetical protein
MESAHLEGVAVVGSRERMEETRTRMLRIFIGFDHRQPIAAQVLAYSIYRRSSKPVAITPLLLGQHPISRVGLTGFTFSRYACPLLCGFEGQSIFMDADMLCLCDVQELIDLAADYPVSVVKNKHRFEWPSLMVFNNEKCFRLSAEFINDEATKPMSLGWADSVGGLPAEYNHLVGYDEPRDDAKIVHFTAGLPCWPETWNCPYGDEWREELMHVNSTVSWDALMGQSVHAELVKSSGWAK